MGCLPQWCGLVLWRWRAEPRPAIGVPEYRVLDPEELAVWVWRLAEGATEPERITDRVEWSPPGASAPFSMSVEEMLRPM